jgi:1,4-alpha-glucan branching enzyme
MKTHPPFRPAALAVGLALVALGVPLPASAWAALPDNDVEWNGISHLPWADRRPLCPVDGESFQVRFQAYRNDLTAARLRVIDGTGAPFSVDAAVIATRGPYDLWAAQVPATDSTTVEYLIELVDGADSDWYGPGGMSNDLPAGPGFGLDFATLSHAPIGATPLPGGGVVFKVWSPNRSGAFVRGQWDGYDASNPMTRVGACFVARVPDAETGQQYRYSFDNGVWNADPRARGLSSSAAPNGVIFDPLAYAWQTADADYQTPPLDRMVVYQLHVGTFAGRNDPYGPAANPSRFIDVANRVSHLHELGVNCVMFNPITAFPADFSAGYNPISQWAPETKYGLPDQVKYMVDRLHAYGIAALIDIVWNHFSTTDNYLWNFDGDQIFFDTPAIATPWGSQADFDSAPVREYFVDSADAWMDEYRLDGFRMDGTDYMNIGAQEAAGWSLMQWFNDEMARRHAQGVRIAEQLPNDNWVTRPTSLGGAGFDAQYHDAFNDNLRQEIFDAAFGDPEMWKISNIINGSGLYLSNSSAFNYLELHDEAWPASGGQRMVKTIDPTFPHDDQYARGRTKLGQGVVLFAPGVPAMLQGDEWLEDTDFGTADDGSNKIDWSKKVTYAPIFAYYRDAIHLRVQQPALWANAGHQVFHVNEAGNVIAWQRWDGAGNVFVIIANFSNTDYPVYRLGLPTGGNWLEAINSEAPGYGGTGQTNPGTLVPDAIAYDGFAQSKEIHLPARALVVLRTGTLVDAGDGGPGGAVPPTLALRFDAVAPNPSAREARFDFTLASAGPARLTIHDARGRRVATVLDGVQAAGPTRATWDGRSAGGSPAPPGIYFARLEQGGRVAVAKVARVLP